MGRQFDRRLASTRARGGPGGRADANLWRRRDGAGAARGAVASCSLVYHVVLTGSMSPRRSEEDRVNLPMPPKIDRDALGARLKPYLRPYLALLAAFLLAISALVRANFFYIDDLGRNVDGYHIWSNFGRWVNEYLSTLVHMDQFLSDV